MQNCSAKLSRYLKLKIPAFRELILWEDKDLLVVNKPPYLSSLDERGPEKEKRSLYSAAKAHDARLRLCHRLDKETSGCLILSKNDAAYRHISLQFTHREIVKTYHAIVHGTHNYKDVKLEFPLATTKTKAKTDFRKGKKALTTITTLSYWRHFTLLECMPLTGRFHQIRAHLEAAGVPIAADPLYGGHYPVLSQLIRKYHLAKEREEERPMISRVALHAYKIGFKDISGQQQEIIAPYAKDFAAFFKLLNRNDKA